MDKKISQKDLEEELRELVMSLDSEKSLGFATYYIRAREKEGYNVKVFKDFVDLIHLISVSGLNMENYHMN